MYLATFLTFLPRACNKGTHQGQTWNIKKPQISPEMLIYRLSEKEILNLIKEGSFSTTLFKLQAILKLFCFMHTKGMQLR